jgi:predicted ArsR family transcriptional regulator
LTAAAVRLGEFGSADLAEAADANLETARAFVRRRKESGMLVEVLSPERTTDEVSKGTGRPRFRYRLADVERARAEVYLERVSGSLAELTGRVSSRA